MGKGAAPQRRQVLTGLGAMGAVAAAPARRPPNIVVVLADDLGYGDLGIQGSNLIATPNLDRLARQGVRMTDFYASANICTPSRAGLQTGRYPIRTGLAYEVIRASDTNGLPLSEITIAEALKPDYATALVGKWHLGHVAPFWPPTQHGYDLFFGLPYSHDMKPLSLYSAGPGVELTQEDVDFPRLTQRFFDRGLQFIEDNRARPFFLTLALTAPHLALFPHPDHAGHSRAAAYGDVVEEIDSQVGRLTARLKALGIDRDTIVIVTSDNGPWMEGSSGPLRDRKGGAGWDGGYRVPNGPAFSADGRWLYHSDTARRTVFRFARLDEARLGERQGQPGNRHEYRLAADNSGDGWQGASPGRDRRSRSLRRADAGCQKPARRTDPV